MFSTYMAGMTLLYLIGISIAARGVNRTILAALSLRYDNRALSKEISNRQAAENALFEEKDRLQTTLAALAEGVVIINEGSQIVYLNPAAEQLSGWSSEEASGLAVEAVFRGLNESTGQIMISAMRESLNRGRPAESDCLLISRHGDKRLVKEIATPLKSRSGDIAGAVAVLRDITSDRRHSRELAHQANHDALTKLPNRLLLWDRLNHAIEKASRDSVSIKLFAQEKLRWLSGILLQPAAAVQGPVQITANPPREPRCTLGTGLESERPALLAGRLRLIR
ncbi:MAG: PAS domain S-box protein [Methylococcaceae bacterium]|nr:PAS domain S-box protein [Methylococcaceae bacterium]